MSEANQVLVHQRETTEVTVVCGDMEWLIHPYILCATSTYFRKLITGAQLPLTLTVPCKDPVKFQWLVDYMFDQRVANDLAALLDHEDTVFETSRDVLLMSHNFGIRSFQSIVIAPLQRIFSVHVRRLQIFQGYLIFGGVDPPYQPVHDESFVKKFFELARIIYSCEHFMDTRPVFIKFFPSTRYKALNSTRFRQELANVQGFIQDILYSVSDYATSDEVDQ